MTQTFAHRHSGPSDAVRPSRGEAAVPGEGVPRPLSPSQRRLWVLSQLEGAEDAYNEPLPYRLRGPLDTVALRRALDTVVARHEIWRSRMVAVDGETYQIAAPAEVGLPMVTLDLSDENPSEERLAEVLRAESAVPFDLSTGPLARGLLVRLAPEDHVLMVTVHHIVIDGASQIILINELNALYAAFLAGADDPLPPVSRQFADHAADQLARTADAEVVAQEAYWRKHLADAPPVLEVPTDRPRPPRQDFTGDQVVLGLDARTTEALRQAAREHGASLFAAVQSGWAVLLSRLSGQTDIVVGIPSANRRGRDADDVIGFFANTLPLRSDLSGDPTVAEVLRRARAGIRGALIHQELPLERVVELVNPLRSTAHTPLFQTTLSWTPALGTLLELPGLTAEKLKLPFIAAKFDLMLMVTEEDGCLTGHLDYATALFDRATAERYARYLERVLTQMAAAPGRTIGELELLDEAERRWLLEDWDATRGDGAVPLAAPASLVARFDAQVAARPGATAVECAGRRLDYGTLARRAERLAAALVARGVRPGQLVGLHAGRTPELVVGLLGILKAGAAFLPLDPGQPDARRAAMIADAAPALVLTDRADAPDGHLDLRSVEAAGDPEKAPVVTTGPEDLAYVLYTSGSTGRPKGVAVTHRSVLNLFDTWLDRFGPTPGEATSAWSGIGFDAMVHELLLPPTTGAELHLVPDGLRGDPDALLTWMREHRIVQAFLPPAYVRWIDEAPGERLAGLALRQLLTGVEPLPEKALHRMTEALPGLRICYGYGPTEATTYSTAYTDPRPLDRSCPIGRPLGNTRLYLLDARMRPVPPGVPGEVWLGGASLAAGYHGRPDLTEERFRPDPFVPGGRIYRTGDLARRLPDGNAEFLGRGDDQIKLRGFRIEPREVETALLALDGVREATVLADRDDAGDLRLVAALGRGDAAPRRADEWRTALARHLPDHMIPALFVEFPVLPLNRSGKVDRKALLAAAHAAPSQVNTAAPRDHVELALHRIWQGVLLRPSISVTDNFFDIGGTSVSAIKVASAVREEFGRTLPIRDLLSHPTIEALAGRLRSDASGQPGSNLIEFRPGDGRRVVCVHPAGGTAFCYLPLATALPPETGVVGIQSPGLNAGEEPLPSVEAMAEEYLRLIEVRADETLVLCGLSYGGLVAHAMGRLLAESGHRGVSVVLLDTRGTDDPEARAAVTPVDADEFRAKLVRFNGMYPGIEDAQIDRYLRVYNHNRMTARDYEVPSTGARLVFVQATEEDEDPATVREVRAFWERRADGGLVTEPVACGHWDILEGAQLPRVAEVIAAELARLPQPAPPTAPDAADPGSAGGAA
ncbi:non-ribosomal peptide synthetase [Streptomyces catenulae]|uniref:Amino acid adenylation domain-containing protein n=1 Tax=Streptomyces catenulae TaxID=66875 RepID=A0ABV2YSD6_9ACTN|nr:amino acid adenylation domain-containing protein [Streptomyces catenulae]